MATRHATHHREHPVGLPVDLEGHGHFNVRLFTLSGDQKELNERCDTVIRLVSDKLLPGADDLLPRIFYLKMLGDYYRYKAEVAPADAKAKFVDLAKENYQTATKAAEELRTTDPLRLGLALNFSVFYYEIEENSQKACKMAKNAYDEAIADRDMADEETYRDSALILQLLRDNVTLWESESTTSI